MLSQYSSVSHFVQFHRSTMQSMAGVVLLVCLGLVLPSNAVIGSEEKYIDRDLMHQVANWLVQAVRNNEAVMYSPQKRNSEIINSILGLPKNLNDAGRK